MTSIKPRWVARNQLVWSKENDFVLALYFFSYTNVNQLGLIDDSIVIIYVVYYRYSNCVKQLIQLWNHNSQGS